jgi:hypothetical protein
VAVSEAAICNVALARIGVNEPIDSLDEATAEAWACKTLYAPTRDALLATVAWPFATRRATLTAIAGTTRSGWAYAFTLPADCLVARYLWSGLRAPPAGLRVPFQIEDDATLGRILLSDAEAPELVYTAKMTVPTTFPALFSDALSWALAADLAMALAVKEGLERRARVGYEQALSRAAAQAFNERGPDPEPDSEFVTVRG